MTLWISEAAIAGWRDEGPNPREAPFVYRSGGLSPSPSGSSGLCPFGFPGRSRTLRPFPSEAERGTSAFRSGGRASCLGFWIAVDGRSVGKGNGRCARHGSSKRRPGRKMHRAVEGEGGEMQAVERGKAGVPEAKGFWPMRGEVEQPLAGAAGEGREACWEVYAALQGCRPGVRRAIPPWQGADLGRHGEARGPPLRREERWGDIRWRGCWAWKRDWGFHRRSRAERAVFRLKILLGSSWRAGLLETRRTQARVRCGALNGMIDLGRPDRHTGT